MFRFIPFLIVLSASLAFAQHSEDYVSEASQVIGTYDPNVASHSPENMAKAGQAFLDSLDDKLRAKAVHALDSPERRKWTNLPARPGAGGVPLGECTKQQVEAFCDLLATVLSSKGYDKMCHIMLADDQLLRGGRARPGFGTETFSVVVFATPDVEKPWAMQLDGHHLGLNVSIEGPKVTISPSFIGTQPKAYNIAGDKFQPLASETADAYRLVESLTDEQLRTALVAEHRGHIHSGPGTDGKVPALSGVSCSTFDASQRELLLKLIAQWVECLPNDQAVQRMRQIETELDETRFGWSGGTKSGSDISYSIQGPSLIIEYACQDLGGDPLNHLHTMYRDPTNEYGKQF